VLGGEHFSEAGTTNYVGEMWCAFCWPLVLTTQKLPHPLATRSSLQHGGTEGQQSDGDVDEVERSGVAEQPLEPLQEQLAS